MIMRKSLLLILLLSGAYAMAQETSIDEFTPQELAVVKAIKAKNTELQPPMQAPKTQISEDANGDIKLSEQAKQQAWEEQKREETESDQTATANAAPPDKTDAKTDKEPPQENDAQQNMTVAFIDIDEAFNQHPRTQSVKKQIDEKIRSKEREVDSAKEVIEALTAENDMLSRQLAELKPFYERIITDQPLLPKIPESADGLDLLNTLNRLTFAGSEMITTSPLNSPARLEDITERITANKKIIAERNFFIDNYKYQTREEILNLEKEEVKNILQDIYTEIKSFAQKRNIAAVVRKDEILYGQQPVNITKDFVSTLKKSKKYRSRK